MSSPLVGIARLAHSAPLLEEKHAVVYRQLPSFQLLNRCSSDRVPFEWTINPYRGCEFGCKYCYARYTHEFMELHHPVQFETMIFAKQWNPADFRRQLARLDPAERIAIGTATDPYQPAERRYELTRSILEVFASLQGRQFSIATKSDLILRDLDLLVEISRANRLHVSITITTLDAALARQLEPGAPRPDLRLKTLGRLNQAGVMTGVLCCPILPLLNDRESQLDELAEAAARAGAKYFGGNVVFLMPAARKAFFPFLEERFPHLARRYRARFQRTPYLRGEYPERIAERIRRVRDKHGLSGRFPDYVPEEWPAEAQLRLAF